MPVSDTAAGVDPHGRIDALTASGNLEGWACDPARPARPARICIRDGDGSEVASGLAHRFRPDLALAGLGLGWCAFRLRADRPASRLRAARLSLFCDGTTTALHEVDGLRLMEAPDDVVTAAPDFFAADPTICHEVTQLEGCASLLHEFAQARGSIAFVRTAYLYLFSRRADPTGLAFYVRRMDDFGVPPYRILLELADGDEFGGARRLLAAPNTPEFPFHCD